MTESPSLSHVIVSQGYPETFGKHRMQPWVENLNEFLQREGFEVHLFACGNSNLCFVEGGTAFSISKRMAGFTDQFSPVAAARSFIDGKPSIALIHGLQHLLTLCSMIVYLVRRVPMFIIVHGLYVSNSKLLALRDFTIRSILHVFRKSYTIIALTEYDRRLLLKEWQIPSDKIKITKAFLYVNETELGKIHRVEKDERAFILERRKIPIFLYMGRLDRDQKRVDQIVKTFHKFLKHKQSTAELVIVGTGPLRDGLTNLATSLNIRDRVKIVGAVTEEEKWLHYLSSSALVLMSKFEGMPRVIFEAFAAGKIVVVPDVCGLSEVVQNSVNGFLFKKDEEVPELLDKVASNSQLIQVMVETVQRLTRTVFTSEMGRKELKLIIESQMKSTVPRSCENEERSNIFNT